MKLEIILGDIKKLDSDVIVETSSTSLLGAHKMMGAIYQEESHYVIHTSEPIWRGGGSGEEELLRDCYETCISLAYEYQCKTIAFPSISTGIYRFPLNKAVKIAISTILECTKQYEDIEMVSIVCLDEITKSYYERELNNQLKR